MYYKRKIYQKLLDWKNNYADSYALLIEGARRIGKSTVAEEFARNEYASYILIDFANVSPDVIDCFDDIHDLDTFKLYLTDTGLFITLMFIDKPDRVNSLYSKMLADKLPANLGYLYENAVAQVIRSKGYELYYHTWQRSESTHYYEIDFLVADKDKINAIEVKSSGRGEFKSLKNFMKKHSKHVNKGIVLSQKDRSHEDGIDLLPVYMINFLC